MTEPKFKVGDKIKDNWGDTYEVIEIVFESREVEGNWCTGNRFAIVPDNRYVLKSFYFETEEEVAAFYSEVRTGWAIDLYWTDDPDVAEELLFAN